MSERFTKRHAVILAGMLGDGVLELLRHFRDRKDLQGDLGDFRQAQELELIEEREDLLSGKKIWVLTAKGKKVAEVGA